MKCPSIQLHEKKKRSAVVVMINPIHVDEAIACLSFTPHATRNGTVKMLPPMPRRVDIVPMAKPPSARKENRGFQKGSIRFIHSPMKEDPKKIAKNPKRIFKKEEGSK